MPSLDGPHLTILASAYGVPGELEAVSAAIYERIFGPTQITLSVNTLNEVPAEWTAIATIVGMLVLNTQDFARVRGGGRPSKFLRTSMADMTSVYVASPPAPEFVERVLADIASALTTHRHDS